MDSAVIRISGNYFAGDSLIFKGITASRNYANASGIFAYIPGKGDSITLSGKATFADYISVLDSLVFKHITTDPTDSTNKQTRDVTFNIREVVPNVDSVGLWSNMTRTFTVVAVNKAPVLTDTRTNKAQSAITFTEMGAAVNIGDSLTLTDDSNNVDSVVIRISNNARS